MPLTKAIKGMNLPKTWRSSQHDPETVNTVKQAFPTMSASEIFNKYGIPKHIVWRIVFRLKLKHTPETLKRFRQEYTDRLLATHLRPESVKQRVRKRKATIKLEYYRVWEGKPQKTRLKLRVLTKRAYNAKNKMINMYGYILSDDPYTILYDNNTRRRPHDGEKRPRFRTEEYYTEKFHFHFKKAQTLKINNYDKEKIHP